MNIKAIYPGTFDPITNGHLELVTRASKIFDLVILAVAAIPTSNKKLMFNFNERIYLANKATTHISNVKVIGFNEMTANFARKQKANILIRGLRSISDFEYEKKLFKVNNYLLPELESIFMFPKENISYISSSLIKEIAFYGGNIEKFLPLSIVKEVKIRSKI